MLIWIIMAIVLVAIVLSGFVGRNRRSAQRQRSDHDGTHHATHHGKGARRSRGRGRGH